MESRIAADRIERLICDLKSSELADGRSCREIVSVSLALKGEPPYLLSLTPYSRSHQSARRLDGPFARLGPELPTWIGV